MKRMPCVVVIPLLLFSIYVQAHPHDDEVTILVLTGTVTKISKEAIEVDFFDREMMIERNLVIFVDAKTKFRKGKLRIASSDLKPGQTVVSTVEREIVGGRIRHRAIEIRLEQNKERR